MRNLIFHPLGEEETRKRIKQLQSDDDLRNLIRSDLLDLFTNLKTLVIHLKTSEVFGSSYSFSLIRFLKIISKHRLDKIIIKSEDGRYISDGNWIKCVWESDKQLLILKIG